MSSALHKSARLPKGVTQKLLGRDTKPLETDRMLQKPKSILKQKHSGKYDKHIGRNHGRGCTYEPQLDHYDHTRQ